MPVRQIKSSFTNMVLSLGLISLISALALAYTYGKTKARIEAAGLQKKIEAVKKVISSFDNQPVSEVYTNQAYPDMEFYPAILDGQETDTGVVLKINGFSDKIKMMVGFNTDYKITGIEVLDQKETPGLGTLIKEPSFKSQFSGLKPDKDKIAVKKDGGSIDAVTAATISSRAFCKGVRQAAAALKKVKGNYSDAETGATEMKNESN